MYYSVEILERKYSGIKEKSEFCERNYKVHISKHKNWKNR